MSVSEKELRSSVLNVLKKLSKFELKGLGFSGGTPGNEFYFVEVKEKGGPVRTFWIETGINKEDLEPEIIESLPISRNAKYELKQKLSGLKKVTFWIPEEQEPELQLLCKKLCENRDLFFTSARMRSRETGRFIPKGDL